MNRRMVLFYVGRIVTLEAALLVLPLIVALIYKEECASAFLITIGVALLCGLAASFVARTKNKVIYAREGFAIVSFAWLFMSALGALPFYISGEIPSYADAFFETVSGLTTTGASILTNIEAMPRALLFWRSFTHFIGGMGVLVLVMAILPDSSGRSIHIMRAEMPGPVVGKIVPKARDTAKILYIMYIFLTLAEVVMLLFGGMSLYEALVHSFGTAGTGGFSVKAAGIAEYSPYIQWVITVFMFIFGINFNLYYLLLIKRFRAVVRSEEMWCYTGAVIVSTAVIAGNIAPMFATAGESIRHAAFQVVSIITTTGYATADFNLWPGLSKAILFVLMFIGGCAGSTAGGLKVSRVILLIKNVFREIRQLLHPRSVSSVRFEGKNVDRQTLSGVNAYFAIYIICFAAVFLLISAEPFGFETNFTAVAACFNNVGPGFGAVGPAGGFSAYSAFAKYILSVAMLLGRLEIFPLILILAPSNYFKKLGKR